MLEKQKVIHHPLIEPTQQGPVICEKEKTATQRLYLPMIPSGALKLSTGRRAPANTLNSSGSQPFPLGFRCLEHGEGPLGFPRNLRDPDVSTAE